MVRLVALLALACPLLPGCTAFCVSNRRMVLVGNNEDYNNPFTRVWFVPGENGRYGRLFVGFDDGNPQGGMNERGLWFDGFATGTIKGSGIAAKPAPPPKFIDKVLSECATVGEAVRLIDRYNRLYLTNAVLMFADAAGDSVVIERDAILPKKGRFQVQTNFHQSLPQPEYDCPRFRIATDMLERAGDDISVNLCRRVLAATHAEGQYPTLYSNVYDLKRKVMYLYHFHNFENVVSFDLAAELKKGTRVLEIPPLFPPTHAANVFLTKRGK